MSATVRVVNGEWRVAAMGGRRDDSTSSATLPHTAAGRLERPTLNTTYERLINLSAAQCREEEELWRPHPQCRGDGRREIIVVGAKKLSDAGAQGCKFSHFLNFKTACAYLRDVRRAASAASKSRRTRSPCKSTRSKARPPF